METMYNGIPFSPQVALSDSIGAGDTTIPVTDVSAFPDAPNLATIGTDEDGETILYAAKTASALSGCTRGIEGTAKAWPSGSTIARNFTNKDFAALQSNIKQANQLADSCNTSVNAILTAGMYSSTTAYVAGNVVTYDGSTWRAKQASTGQTPAENAYWTCLAAKGAPGDPGYTPQKGTDYWTDADQQAMVQDVLAALPDGDEVSY